MKDNRNPLMDRFFLLVDELSYMFNWASIEMPSVVKDNTIENISLSKDKIKIGRNIKNKMSRQDIIRLAQKIFKHYTGLEYEHSALKTGKDELLDPTLGLKDL